MDSYSDDYGYLLNFQDISTSSSQKKKICDIVHISYLLCHYFSGIQEMCFKLITSHFI